MVLTYEPVDGQQGVPPHLLVAVPAKQGEVVLDQAGGVGLHLQLPGRGQLELVVQSDARQAGGLLHLG